MTPEQCREARNLLGWTQLRLAVRAGCSVRTVQCFENKWHPTSARMFAAIRAALGAAGVEFAGEEASRVVLTAKPR